MITDDIKSIREVLAKGDSDSCISAGFTPGGADRLTRLLDYVAELEGLIGVFKNYVNCGHHMHLDECGRCNNLKLIRALQAKWKGEYEKEIRKI